MKCKVEEGKGLKEGREEGDRLGVFKILSIQNSQISERQHNKSKVTVIPNFPK